MQIRGRNVVVVGLGRSGRAAAAYAASLGARVVGVDLREDVAPIEGVRLELGPHRRETFVGADLLILSPGVPATQADVAAADDAGVTVLGELAFASNFLSQPMACITGTNGKSTVSWFAGQLLEAAGMKPFVGGNLGNPLTNAIRGDHDCLVVEVSSYQLEWPGTLHPRVGVVLNLTEDHLGRHGDMDTYGRIKCRLFDRMNQTDLAVLPYGDERLTRLGRRRQGAAWIGGLPGVVRHGDGIVVRAPGADALLSLDGFSVPGTHNKDNAAVAALIALALGADADAVQAALPGLRPLAHRMEVVAEQSGVTWINDSKATNVDATAVGLRGLDRPVVLLLGGQSKGPGFAALAPDLAGQRGVLTFGADGDTIAAELEAAGVGVTRSTTLEHAIDEASTLAQPGDIVLLSPGCASFDAFDDFEHRGRVFRALVEQRENP